MKVKLKVGDRVKIRTDKFGEAYATNKPEYTIGTIKGTKKQDSSVKWDGSSGLWSSHLTHLVGLKPALPSIVIRKDQVWEVPDYIPPREAEGVYANMSLV